MAAEHLNELASCRIAALDLRGHGETVGAAGEGTMAKDSLARDVREVGDQLLLRGGHQVCMNRNNEEVPVPISFLCFSVCGWSYLSFNGSKKVFQS